MKKLFFIFFTFITFTNSSYASFPVSDTLKVEHDTLQSEVIKQYHYSLQLMSIDLKSCKCESCRNGVTPLLSKSNILYKKKEIEIQKDKTETNGNLFIFLSVLSALGAIVFAFLSIGSGMMHNGNPLPYLILTLVSTSASILSRVIAKKRAAKTGKAFLGLGVLALGVLLFMLLFSG